MYAAWCVRALMEQKMSLKNRIVKYQQNFN